MHASEECNHANDDLDSGVGTTCEQRRWNGDEFLTRGWGPPAGAGLVWFYMGNHIPPFEAGGSDRRMTVREEEESPLTSLVETMRDWWDLVLGNDWFGCARRWEPLSVRFTVYSSLSICLG